MGHSVPKSSRNYGFEKSRRRTSHRPQFLLDGLSVQMQGILGLPQWLWNLLLLSSTYWGLSFANLLAFYEVGSTPIRVAPGPLGLVVVQHPTLTVIGGTEAVLFGLCLMSQVGTLYCNQVIDNLRTQVKPVISVDARTWYNSKIISLTNLKSPGAIALFSAVAIGAWLPWPLPSNLRLVVLDILITALGTGPIIMAGFFLLFFVCTFLVSVLRIVQKLNSPLTPVSFGKDPRLGLKPFAAAALRITIAYELIAALLVVAILMVRELQGYTLSWYGLNQVAPSLELTSELTFMGGGLFLVCLYRIHKVLVEERRKYLARIGAQRERLLVPFISDLFVTGHESPEQLEYLSRTEELVQRIPSWPFDTGLLFKLILSLGAFATAIGALLGLLSKI